MADLLKIFREIGELYGAEALQTYNEIDRKNIEGIALYDIRDGSLRMTDSQTASSRLFLRVTSPNGGNLYPFFFYAPGKLNDAIKKSFKNMKKYLPSDRQEQLESIRERVNPGQIIEKMKPYEKKKNIYLALCYEGKTLYELFPEVAESYAKNVCKTEVAKEGASYFSRHALIGFDAGLNFCSVNELPKSLQREVKYRLLPLSQEEACEVKQGFSKVFEAQMFRFTLFGLSYYLLPTIFAERKKEFYDLLEKLSRDESGAEKVENRLDRLVKRLEDAKLHEKVLLSFLFARRQNNAIDLYHLIEDVAPSRIVRAFALMETMKIDEHASRYVKKSERIDDYLYIRDYVEDGLTLAKLMFGVERLSRRETVVSWIAGKILYGDNRPKPEPGKLSEILAFETVEDFEKHQRFLDFLAELEAVSFDTKNFLKTKEENMSTESFSEIALEKFESVELLKQKPRAREFYVLGALAKFVMNWQYKYGQRSKSFQKYLDGIGTLTMRNKERVFRKIYDASRKYGMHGDDYEDLMELYVRIKERLCRDDKVSLDEANISFVMGAVDWKTYEKIHKNTKKERNDG